MTDCPTVEVQDLLPDYLHQSLAALDRARVESHLAACAACAAEVAMLRSARAVLARVPAVAPDTAAIVAALPRPGASRPVVLHASPPASSPSTARAHARPPFRRAPTLYRLAAAISFVSLGGISVAVARSYFSDAPVLAVDSLGSVRREVDGGYPTLASGVDSPRAGTAVSRALSMHPSVADLDDADLESLLGELDHLEAAPLAEPENTPGARTFGGAILGS